jgi:hypothetical protein
MRFAAVPHVIIAPDLEHFVVAIADESQDVKLIASRLLKKAYRDLELCDCLPAVEGGYWDARL